MSLIQAELRPLIGDYNLDPPTPTGSHECDVLVALVDQSDLTRASAAACRDAVERLRWAFDVHQRMPTRGTRANVVVAWPIVIPAAFVAMLQQRKPEAMVIFVYYAVLLHQSRDFWVFGEGGRFLLRVVSTHLGPYWAEWLVWPNEMIENGRRDGV
jgi:hypothetical protein